MSEGLLTPSAVGQGTDETTAWQGCRMANEELHQRGYLNERGLRGGRFGAYEEFNIGSTSVRELIRVGIAATVPASINYSFKYYRPPQKPESAKPDRLFVHRRSGRLTPVAVGSRRPQQNSARIRN